ncbi:MAG: hypothetical protein NTW76_05595 [Corynebacteriales bacterium]|nr:hypothetical protein [Mycobacteriales bacterium]
MREEIDYEATKAALRAQVSATPSAHHAASAGWRWFSAVAGVVVVVCAVTVTLWATHGGSEAQMRLVPSAGHESAHSSPSSDATSAPAGTPTPAAIGAPTPAAAPIEPVAAPAADDAVVPGDDGADVGVGVGPVAPGPVVAPQTDAAGAATPSPTRDGGTPSRPSTGPAAPAPAPSTVTPPPVTAPPVTAPPNTDPAPSSGGGASDPGGSGGGGGQSSSGTDSGGTTG